MSAFSECFNLIKERRNLNSAQVAEICNIDTSVVYKWSKGGHAPKKWAIVESMVEKLHLSNDEKRDLQHAYEKTILGDEKYHSYQKIIEILDTLHKRGQEYNSQKYGKNVFDDVILGTLPEYGEFSNKLEIMQCIQNALVYISGKDKKKIYLKIQPLHQNIIMMLRMFCVNVEECELEEIAYFVNESYGSTVYNLDVLKGLIDLLVQKHPIQIYCREESKEENHVLDNWIITDEFAIEFADDFSYGMITTNSNWIAHFQKNYEEIKNNSQVLGKKRCTTPEEYLLSITEEMELLGAMEHMPCLGNCLTKEILEQHILPDIPGREELMAMILSYGQSLESKKIKNGRSFFFREGLIEFMETGIFEVFPYGVYQPPGYESCCDILQNGIEFAKKGLMNYQMVREGQLPSMKDIYIEQVYGDVEHLVIDIHFDHGRKERFEIFSEVIKKEFESFFEFLQDSAYLYSVEETVEQMQEIVEAYRRKARELASV